MKSFFKMMFASMLGTAILLTISFFIFMGIIAAFVSLSEQKIKPIEANSILHIKLDKLRNNIDRAINDPNIKGIYLDLSSVPASFATLEEIREKLIEFKKSGKFIISYADIYGQGAYYLATVSDKIYLNPQGEIDLKGLTAELFFLKNLFEKTGMEMQVIRHGKFKSAIEPFILDKMSEANREQIKTYTGSIWNDIVEKIAVTRNISVAEIQKITDSLDSRFPEKALAGKLVDELKYRDEVINILKEKSGIGADDDLKLVSYTDYKNSHISTPSTEKNKIAIIYATGSIIKGKGGNDEIGDLSLAKSIAEARKDDNIKAIVLRINSPGGDALASENILREITLAKEKKPVIASFGDVAASGGYYIACKANKIIAQPNTITGSIGVFGMIPNAQKLLKDKIGITFDTVKTNANSDFISAYRPMSSHQQLVLHKNIENIYDVFITHVSQGRNMSKAAVDSIGEGRVWSGIDAHRIGLVDELGGIDKAIEAAKQFAKIENYQIISLPKEKNTMEALLENFNQSASTKYLINEIGKENYMLLRNAKELMEIKGIQARMPLLINVY